MLFDQNNIHYGLFERVPGSDFNEVSNSPKVWGPMEGFLRGNLFKNEYDAYQNMTYFKLKPMNEQEELLLKIMAYCFALNDLNLYLDLHPDDYELYSLWKQYVTVEKDLEDEYAKKYGPLKTSDVSGNTFNWIQKPWPWNNDGGVKYV